MVQVKAQQKETGPVQHIITRYPEKLVCQVIEIFGIAIHNTQFDEIEIEKMDYQENKNTPAGPYHKLRKK